MIKIVLGFTKLKLGQKPPYMNMRGILVIFWFGVKIVD